MITGSLVALVTPMKPDGSLDWIKLDQLVNMHVEQGTDAIVAVGTTGESATLDVVEHSQVIARVVKTTAGRVPVIAGTGANSTSEAIELTVAAKGHGADACLLVTPYYNKPTQEGLFLHHKAIAEAVDIPQILYNVPGRTACDMLADTVIRLSKIDNIVGVKEATGDLGRGEAILKDVGENFVLYSGDDASATELMLGGAKGNISVTANIAPQAMAAMCKAAIAGDSSKAREINKGLEDLHNKLFLESNPIPVKWALCEMGLIEEGIRLPLTWLAEQYREPLRRSLKNAGLL